MKCIAAGEPYCEWEIRQAVPDQKRPGKASKLTTRRQGKMEDLIERAAKDLVTSNYAIALTGAGISTESGIPDFRGPDGLWTKNPEAERQAYLAYERFKVDPRGYWEQRLSPDDPFRRWFAKFLEVQPNPGHYALAELERMSILKCVITQNVDGLHTKAGTQNVIEYHGGLDKLRCVECSSRFGTNRFDLEKLKSQGKLPPRCEKCGGVVKEDGVFFGEPIPADVLQRSEEEASKCDAVLICGTSAVVYPFANLPRIARRRAGVVEIEVNADPTPLTGEGISDYLIQGKTGEVLPKIVQQIKKIR